MARAIREYVNSQQSVSRSPYDTHPGQVEHRKGDGVVVEPSRTVLTRFVTLWFTRLVPCSEDLFAFSSATTTVLAPVWMSINGGGHCSVQILDDRRTHLEADQVFSRCRPCGGRTASGSRLLVQRLPTRHTHDIVFVRRRSSRVMV
jgi:hypothetical protein